MRPRAIVLSLTIIALAAQMLGLAAPALAANPTVVPFSFTGSEQTFDVPTGILSLHVVLIGATGGQASGVAGGHGARVEGDLAVVPGDHLFIEVGGNGGDAVFSQTIVPGGFNGGGNGGYYRNGTEASASGGGASDIRSVTRTDNSSLASRLVVAAGGGGAGVIGSAATGGDAGQPGGQPAGTTAGGGAGTASAGGAGGTGSNLNGSPGGLGVGGAGSDATITGLGGGGGGGGGRYGGGGGAYQGGGGGGSNLTSGLTNAAVTTDATGTPSITISYTTSPNDHGTVHVQFSVPTSAACLSLSTTSVDFGSVHLGSEAVAAAPEITVTSCSDTPEDLFAHGSDATATGVTWTLVGGSATCADTLGTDNYRLELEATTGTVGLSTANANIGTLAAGDASTQTARLFAACPGSTGGGQLMTTQITFLAVEGG